MTWRVPTNSAPKRRRDWRPGFLSHFAASGNVMLSAKAAGIDRNLPYLERRKNPRFAEAWEQAEEDSIQLLEAEARRRAMASSDTLMIFLLKARRPRVYREHQRVELTGLADSSLIPGPLAHLTDQQLALARKAIDDLVENVEREAAAGKADAERDVSGEGTRQG